MNDQSASIWFRPLEHRDLPLMHRWVNTPYVAEWWDPLPTLADVSAKYGGRIDGNDPTRSFIIVSGAEPIGYIQTYRIADYPQYNEHVEAEADAVGVDLFIGDASHAGQGIGSIALRKFLRMIVFADESIAECIIGPEPQNHRAIRSYEKAGFRYWKTVQVPGERAPEYLMRAARAELDNRT